MSNVDFPEFPESVSTSWELVTPEIAEKYLGQNTHNRPMRKHNVSLMTHDMTHGRFLLTHQGLAFDEDGVMLDGQQRCQAVIDSGQAVWMLVTVGLPRRSQHMMDLGAKRSAADFLEGKYASTRAATHRLLLAAKPLLPDVDPVKLKDIARYISVPEILERTPEEALEPTEKLAWVTREAAKILPAISPSPLLAACLISFDNSVDKSREFLEGIRDLTGLEKGDPRLALIKYRGVEGRHTNQMAALAICLRITEAYKHGRSYGVIRNPWQAVKVEP